jgi:5-(carboxyamino)imidazole ribonucleotide synthase
MKVGIIGAGQLGRMLALAGHPLGLDFVFVDESPDAPGARVGTLIPGRFDDPAALAALAADSDIVTFDVENVPQSAAEGIAADVPFLPPPVALGSGQDRLVEKRLFADLGIPTPAYAAVDSADALADAVDTVGLPAILKTRRLGYDGRGQALLREPADLDGAWERLGGVPAILESFVHFDREVSLIGVRSVSGETAFYPLAENVHESGILRLTRAPWEDPGLHALAVRHLSALMDRLDYAGVLTVEFFAVGGQLYANEMAPRVHNSGHWTIEGAVTSQFENHLRAILDLPLGATDALGHAGMVNFIGRMPAAREVLAIPRAHLHDYMKSPRPGRKLGHCTVMAPDPAGRDDAMARVAALAPKA